MRIPAISALLVASAATFVSAAPAKNETAPRVSYTEEHPPADEAEAWDELASATPARHGRVYITVEGPYARLRFDAVKGKPTVRAVKVRYADGKAKTVRIGRTLAGKRSSHAVDLGPARAIEHIVVITEKGSQGSYAVFGAARPAATAVATR